MNYEASIDFLYSQLPMFHRVGKAAYKEGIGNIVELCSMLDNPHKQFKSVHIAGTNGKGSTSHYLAAIFQTAGYKTGLFTSPHLKDFRERIKINGEMIAEQEVIDFVDWMQKKAMHLQPSFFEMNVALAFHYFAKENVDIAIIETGLGGRLDSTNIIHPELSLITNIGYDHMDLLGNTLEKIAAEKAGIIKAETPVVISQWQAETANVFLKKALDENASIYFASKEITIKNVRQEFHESRLKLCGAVEFHWSDFEFISELAGIYQKNNLPGVIKAVELLAKQGWELSIENIMDGIKKVVTLTGIKGRWQQLGASPLVFCDTGHNVDGIQEVLNQLKQITFNRLHIVFGMVGDKDTKGILQLLPNQASYYFCKPAIERGLDAELLKAYAAQFSLFGETYHSVGEAYTTALKKALPNDLIFIGGSTFVVAEVV